MTGTAYQSNRHRLRRRASNKTVELEGKAEDSSNVPNATQSVVDVRPAIKPKKTDRVASGVSTNKLVFSAYRASNDHVFPNILKLYVPKKSIVADVTYGKGIFWKQVKRED